MVRGNGGPQTSYREAVLGNVIAIGAVVRSSSPRAGRSCLWTVTRGHNTSPLFLFSPIRSGIPKTLRSEQDVRHFWGRTVTCGRSMRQTSTKSPPSMAHIPLWVPPRLRLLVSVEQGYPLFLPPIPFMNQHSFSSFAGKNFSVFYRFVPPYGSSGVAGALWASTLRHRQEYIKINQP